jgi:hypothetical protein
MSDLTLPFAGSSGNHPDVAGFQVADNSAGIAVAGISTGSSLFPGLPVVESIGVRGISQAVPGPFPPTGPVPQQLLSIGVQGLSEGATGVGVSGTGGTGVVGESQALDGTGVEGIGATGVFGTSIRPTGSGVLGRNDAEGGVGVSGTSANGTGIVGVGGHNGVIGRTNSAKDAGVNGTNGGNGLGVFGGSVGGSGVEGHSTNGTGVVGFSQQGLAGRFLGNVEVTGNLHMNSPTGDIVLGDVAEGFSAQGGEIIEPGTVVVLNQFGLVRPGDEAYDKKVAGVVSGAGDYRPAIVLDQRCSQDSRLPVALMGKVCCKVDAQYAPIEVGDLLTSSPTRGHAMKAADPLKSFGSVIGKALCSLDAGQGMIPILVALQ